MNSFGNKLRLTTFGESHGPAIGGIIDGFPSNFKINFERLNEELANRAPGSSQLVTQRKEKDIPEFLSGISEDGITYGTPIGFIIRNSDNRGKDYSELKEKYRPNHADFTYDVKFGIRDYKGGGRASARETANWVVAGALANQWLNDKGIIIDSVLSGAGRVSYADTFLKQLSEDPDNPCLSLPDKIKEEINEEILTAKNDGDSVGGVVTCLIKGLPAGYGNPVFDKLHARLDQAMLTINAAKGFEYGSGMNLSMMRGSEVLDLFEVEDNKIITEKNHSGGIQGGISNGMSIFFNVAFKPTPTIFMEVETVDKNLHCTHLNMKGRHDPCVAVRAVPVVKAMSSLVIADFLL